MENELPLSSGICATDQSTGNTNMSTDTTTMNFLLMPGEPFFVLCFVKLTILSVTEKINSLI